MAGIYSYAMSAGDTFKGFSRAVRRAAMGKCVRGYGFAKDEFVCDEWRK